jgi:murein L,D-transpeptidase YcbB/YkuD
MDRWRWLPRDLGRSICSPTSRIHAALQRGRQDHQDLSHRRRQAGPHRHAAIAEKVQAVVFNPTWTVPQSIVKGENLGAKLLANPASAARQGYKVTKAENGVVTVVQQPGDKNSLGRMKIDMPNPHAIYLHDTPPRRCSNPGARLFPRLHPHAGRAEAGHDHRHAARRHDGRMRPRNSTTR